MLLFCKYVTPIRRDLYPIKVDKIRPLSISNKTLILIRVCTLPQHKQMATSLAVIDNDSSKRFIFLNFFSVTTLLYCKLFLLVKYVVLVLVLLKQFFLIQVKEIVDSLRAINGKESPGVCTKIGKFFNLSSAVFSEPFLLEANILF